jgi:hypothetical protein
MLVIFIKTIKILFYLLIKKNKFVNFLNKFQIVSKEEFFDKENNDIIYIYKNYFRADPKGKILRSNIINLSKEINYSSLVLDVIKDYSTMLTTFGDPELDLIPNFKDQLALMNVELNYFISTKEELEILIEALELELKNSVNPTFYYRNEIELLIKNLKKLCFLNNLKTKKEKFINLVLFFIIMMFFDFKKFVLTIKTSSVLSYKKKKRFFSPNSRENIVQI